MFKWGCWDVREIITSLTNHWRDVGDETEVKRQDRLNVLIEF